MNKTCRACSISKNEECFAKKKTRSDGSILRVTICKECQKEVSKRHYRENKKDYIIKNKNKKIELRKLVNCIKSNSKCDRCGISGEDMPESMDFKYKNPNDKKRKISEFISYSKKIILQEIAKCNVFCANCQRIVDLERSSATT